MLAVCQENVHTVFETNKVEEIGQGPLSIISVRRYTGDRSKDIEITLTQKTAESKGFSFSIDVSQDVD